MDPVWPQHQEQKGFVMMLPLAQAEGAESLLELACGLCYGGRGRIIALGVVEVAEGSSFAEASPLVRGFRQRLLRAVRPWQSAGVEITPQVRVSRQAWQGIQEAIVEEEADVVLLDWRGSAPLAGHGAGPGTKVFGTTMRAIVGKPPCDTVVMRRATACPYQRILLPLRGGPQAELALRLVLGLSEAFQATVTVLNIVLESSSSLQRQGEEQLFQRLLQATRGHPRIQERSLMAPSIETAILEQAPGYDLVVMGAAALPPQEAGSPPEPTETLLGRIAERVLWEAPTSVMVVKTKEPMDPQVFLPAGAAMTGAGVRSSIVAVEKWFGENTFHSREFSRVEELVELKRRQGLTISLGLPALNEEGTVGRVIEVLKEELLERRPLLDEIVLVDGGSTDRTQEIARSKGIAVYRQEEILPQYGLHSGKGEALWKSLYVLSGDIIVWMDTDIKNIHPKFVYGVVGPLLRERRLKYVVGFYGRPLRIGPAVYEVGGDRVNELTARPLLNLFYPELSGLVEPASRETAAYREVLEQIPFFTGYGVELGNLIDIFHRFGLGAIGQADLEERIHRETSLLASAERAYALVKVVTRRLERRARVSLLDDLNTTMKLIHRREEGFSLELKEIGDIERPPMITLPEYQERPRKARGR